MGFWHNASGSASDFCKSPDQSFEKLWRDADADPACPGSGVAKDSGGGATGFFKNPVQRFLKLFGPSRWRCETGRGGPKKL